MTTVAKHSDQLATILQAVLLAHGKPLSMSLLVELFAAEQLDAATIQQGLRQLSDNLQGSALELKELASGYRIQIRQEFAHYIGRLWEERPQRYSRALLETLALIAYKQPATRGEIEDVRGVAVGSQIIKTLQERDWVKVVGYKDVPGKPAMLATTKAFLDYFNLSSLDQLPPLKEVRDLSAAFDKLQENLLETVDKSVNASDSESTEHDDSESTPMRELSFSSLLAELESMETNLKTDFDDLLEQPDASQGSDSDNA